MNVRILGGLMALGYEIGSILKRTSRVWQDDHLMIKIDEIDGMEHKFVQVGLSLCKGKLPDKVKAAWWRGLPAGSDIMQATWFLAGMGCLQNSRSPPGSEAKFSCLYHFLYKTCAIVCLPLPALTTLAADSNRLCISETSPPSRCRSRARTGREWRPPGVRWAWMGPTLPAHTSSR